MPVTITHLLTAGSSTNATSYTTTSISPRAGKLVLVAVGSDVGSGTANNPTCTGANTTWTEVVALNSGGGERQITIFRGLVGGSGALTFDFSAQTQLNCQWSIAELGNVDRTGTNGSNAIVQNATNTSASASNITTTLSSFTSTDNATYGAVFINSSSAITEGTGFSELGEATNETTIQSQWKNANDTSVDWSWSGSSVVVSVALELKFRQDTPQAALAWG